MVIDHLGLTRAGGLPALLRLAERGARVKATGFGRLDFAPGPVLRDLARANPDARLFGTDLPSTRAPRPFRAEDVALIIDALAPLGPDVTAKALVENAVALYRPRAVAAWRRGGVAAWRRLDRVGCAAPAAHGLRMRRASDGFPRARE